MNLSGFRCQMSKKFTSKIEAVPNRFLAASRFDGFESDSVARRGAVAGEHAGPSGHGGKRFGSTAGGEIGRGSERFAGVSRTLREADARLRNAWPFALGNRGLGIVKAHIPPASLGEELRALGGMLQCSHARWPHGPLKAFSWSRWISAASERQSPIGLFR